MVNTSRPPMALSNLDDVKRIADLKVEGVSIRSVNWQLAGTRLAGLVLTRRAPVTRGARRHTRSKIPRATRVIGVIGVIGSQIAKVKFL
jgi:hypothetical protein